MKKFLVLFLLLFFNFAYAAELSQYDRVLRSQVLYKAGNNYVEDIRYNGNKIVRWNKAEFPIKVYIEENVKGIPNYYKSYSKQGANVWQEETNGVVKLKFVDEEKDANIIVKVLEENSPDDTMAYTETRFAWYWWTYKLDKAVIFLYKKDKKGNFYTPREISNVIVHEFGHALGLCGHTKHKTSVMSEYYSSDNSKTPPILDPWDVNTIRFLYKIEPDITNGDKKKETDNWITPQILFL